MRLPEFPAFDRYVESGIEWIGAVPAHWEVTKLGACLKPVSEKNHPDLPLLSITRERGVIERDVEDQEANHNYIPDDLSGYKLLREGQFGMNKMKAWQGSYGVSAYTGIVSPAYFIFNFAKQIEPGFFNVAIRSKLYVSYFGSASDGVRIGQWDLNKSRMREIPFLLPPPNEQCAIATFLDEKTAKIDQAIRIKEQQITLLKERKQIVIQTAVTKGLNPDAPMKHSGIDWIGEIPAHWEVKRNKYVFRESNERSETGQEQHLSMSQKLGLVPAHLVEKSLVSESYEGAKLVQEGDLVLNRLKAHLAVFSITPMDGVVSPDYSVFRPFREDVSRFYCEALLKTSKYLGEFRLRVRGIVEGFYRLYSDDFMDIPFLLPPLVEQVQIVDFIRSESARIEEGVAIKERQITALKEYKTSLINAAVTGKIKVT